MKIPIKFRGRDIAGTMRFGHYVTLDDYPFIKQDGCYYEVYPDSVAQLVGYDSAGNEVYEGDELVNRNFQVDFFTAVLFDGVITDEGFSHDIPVEMLTLKE